MDINASKQFYENLGLKVFTGDIKKNYLIMKNENSLIGLFYGMFEKTILTFNSGCDENANKIEKFEDVSEIQRNLKALNYLVKRIKKHRALQALSLLIQAEIKYFLTNTFNV